MNRRSGGALVLCMAVSTLVLCYRADAENQSDWFRWSPGGGVVQHVVSNDSAVLRKLTISSTFSGSCDSNELPRFGRNDRRFSFGTAYVELKPHAWIALFSPIAEREVGCKVDLVLGKPEGGAEKLSSVKLTPGVEYIDFLPFESGELTVDASVVKDDLLFPFEPAGTSIQVQVRVRNLSADTRMIAITRRRLDCERNVSYDWVVGPGEAPVQISAGPVVVKPKAAVVFSQRLRGMGDLKACTASFAVSDARRPSESKIALDHQPSKWVEVKDLSVPLESAQVVSYR